MIKYTYENSSESGLCVCCGWEKITSVLTGLERLRGKASTKAVGPGFYGSESAIRWERFK